MRTPELAHDHGLCCRGQKTGLTPLALSTARGPKDAAGRPHLVDVRYGRSREEVHGARHPLPERLPEMAVETFFLEAMLPVAKVCNDVAVDLQ